MLDKSALLPEHDYFKVVNSFINEVLTQPHTQNMKDFYKTLIDKIFKMKNEKLLNSVIRNVFTKPHTAEMGDLYKYIIQRSLEPNSFASGVITEFVRYPFTQPHTQNMRELYQIALDYAGDNKSYIMLRDFAVKVFTEPHTAGMVDLYKSFVINSIKAKDIYALEAFDQLALKSPHTRGANFDSIRDVVKEAVKVNTNIDWPALNSLAEERFRLDSLVIQLCH